MKPPNAANSQALSLLSASDVSRLANTKQLGVSHSLKQYTIKTPCRPVITNSLSDGWTLFCTMSDKWLLSTNQSIFMVEVPYSHLDFCTSGVMKNTKTPK